MNELKYFKSEPELDLTAAHIGISCFDWVCVENPQVLEAHETMQRNRFDILPVLENGVITGYYESPQWGNFSDLPVFKSIDSAPKVYFRMSVFDLLRKIDSEKQLFYFLESSSGIVGLVTIGNLNFKAVYAQVFQLIIGIERAMSQIISQFIDENEILESFRQASDKSCRAIAEQHFDDIKKNADVSLFEKMYLSNYSVILKRFKERFPDDAKLVCSYQKKFGPNSVLNLVRNRAAHPNRSLINSNSPLLSVSQLLEVIDAYSTIIKVADLTSVYSQKE